MALTGSHGPAVEFCFVLIPRFNMLALTAVLEPLRVANYLSGRRLYGWQFLAPDGGAVTASNGMRLEARPLPRGPIRAHTVFVCGSWDCEHYDNGKLFSWLRRLDRAGVRLGTMDIASYVLARAGLLAGHRVAVLWYCIRAFREAHPDVVAEACLFADDGARITIAGGTAGLDAMIADVRARHGERLAHEVADHILHHPLRGPDDGQRSGRGGRRRIAHPAVRSAVALMEDRLEDPLTIPVIADRVGVSQRKLERLFEKHAGQPPVAHYRMLRLQHARVLLTNTNLPVREISVACGYSSLSHFAKAFARQFGKRPGESRIAWPDTEPAPVWLGLAEGVRE